MSVRLTTTTVRWSENAPGKPTQSTVFPQPTKTMTMEGTVDGSGNDNAPATSNCDSVDDDVGSMYGDWFALAFAF